MLGSAKELGLGDACAKGSWNCPRMRRWASRCALPSKLDDGGARLCNVTPNRGDATSIIGIAREVAALERQLIGPARVTGNALRAPMTRR